MQFVGRRTPSKVTSGVGNLVLQGERTALALNALWPTVS